MEPQRFKMATATRDGDDFAVPRAVRAVQRVAVGEESVTVGCAFDIDFEEVAATRAGLKQSGANDEPSLGDSDNIPTADVEDPANRG